MTVLIVDDHALFRSRACRLLENAGYTVVGEAPDASSAIEAATRLKPDVILLDVQLPDGDGFTVASELAAASDPPMVVLVSSRRAIDYGSRLTESSAAGFIYKPELSRRALERVVGLAA